MKLILLDGPPGSGKTSLAEALVEAIPSSVLLLEMDPHHPLHPVPVGDIGADFSDLAIESLSDLANLLIKRWSDFLESATPDITLILESYPFQSHCRVLWQFGATESEIQEFQRRVASLLASHESILVYLTFRQYAAVLPNIFEARGQEWVQFIQEFFEDAPVGQKLVAEGKATAGEMLLEYSKVLDAWFLDWPLTKIALEAWASKPVAQAVELRQVLLNP